MSKKAEFEKWSGRIISLIIAVLLFLYVSYENSRMISSYNPGGGASISAEETVTSVPIEINVDTNQYFVSGVPESATVTLRGPQAVITQFLATNELVTQTPDLNELGVGNHDISLNVKYLPNRVEADIMPASIDITIERKVVREYNIGVLYDDNIFAEGTKVGDPQLSQNTAVVSGRESEMEQVDRVVAVIPPGSQPYTESINGNFSLVAYNSQNDIVDVSIEPSEINVVIPLESNEKTVPLELEAGGGSDDYDYEIRIASDQMDKVVLRGPQSVLDNIDSLTVPVDLTGITNSTTRTIDLPRPEGVDDMSLSTVTVVIDARRKDNTDNEESDEESRPAEDQENTRENSRADEPENEGSVEADSSSIESERESIQESSDVLGN